jgi:Chlorophyll A-B binding protein
MKTAILSLLVGSAVAFAPPSSSRVSSSATTALNVMTFEDQPGVLQPTGYWDPLGLSTSEQLFDYYREVELKHGRVAQLAVIGFVVPEFFRFNYDIAPGVNTATVTNGWAALGEIPVIGWLWVLAAVGAVETKGWLRYDIGVPNLATDVLKVRQTQELQYVFGRIGFCSVDVGRPIDPSAHSSSRMKMYCSPLYLP